MGTGWDGMGVSRLLPAYVNRSEVSCLLLAIVIDGFFFKAGNTCEEGHSVADWKYAGVKERRSLSI